MERIFEIKKFRNLGFEKPLDITLNPNFENQKGGLVILIGHNNLGKSNVIDALNALSADNKLNKDNDTPYFDDSGTDISLSLKVVDSSNGHIMESCSTSLKGENKNNKINSKIGDKIREQLEPDEEAFINEIMKYYEANGSEAFKELKNNEEEYKEYCDYVNSSKDEDHLSGKLISFLYETLCKHPPRIPNGAPLYTKTSDRDTIARHFATKFHPSNLEKLKQCTGSTSPNHKIINATMIGNDKSDYKINGKSLVMEFDKAYDLPDKPSPFLKTIFNMIDYDYKQLKNRYTKASKLDPSILEELAESINKQIDKTIGKNFNDFFKAEVGNDYIFKINLQPTYVSLSIKFSNNQIFNFDQGSTGFRWMFNFYFTFYDQINALQPGDIILIDEPCAYLHDSCIKELRDYLRDFAKRKGITIVIATLRPAFVDVDNLEEVRMLRKINGNIIVQNIFTNPENGEKVGNDFLKFIIDALSTNRNALVDGVATDVIFVEGSTDYYYFTGYKQYLTRTSGEKCNLTFLPLGGVGDNSDIVENIKKLDKVPFFFVDMDGGGETFYETIKDDNTIYKTRYQDIPTLNSLKEVEDIFSEDEKNKYHLGQKTFAVATNIKQAIEAGELSDDTYSKFKEIFDFFKSYRAKYDIVLKEHEELKPADIDPNKNDDGNEPIKNVATQETT